MATETLTALPRVRVRRFMVGVWTVHCLPCSRSPADLEWGVAVGDHATAMNVAVIHTALHLATEPPC